MSAPRSAASPCIAAAGLSACRHGPPRPPALNLPPPLGSAPGAGPSQGACVLAKEHAMASPVHFHSHIGEQFLRYAGLVAGRGYVHNTLGNIAIRAMHPDHPDGVAYTKHAEISLEEMGVENIVITEIPTSRLL